MQATKGILDPWVRFVSDAGEYACWMKGCWQFLGWHKPPVGVLQRWKCSPPNLQPHVGTIRYLWINGRVDIRAADGVISCVPKATMLSPADDIWLPDWEPTEEDGRAAAGALDQRPAP